MEKNENDLQSFFLDGEKWKQSTKPFYDKKSENDFQTKWKTNESNLKSFSWIKSESAFQTKYRKVVVKSGSDVQSSFYEKGKLIFKLNGIKMKVIYKAFFWPDGK